MESGSTRRCPNRWQVLACIVGVLAFLLFWPKSYLASPRWEVWVVTEDGRPLSDMNVHLYYHNYSAESEFHHITLQTDKSGYVVFEPHYQRASLWRQIVYSIAQIRKYYYEASFGRHAHVFAVNAEYSGSDVTGEYLTDWTGSPHQMKSRIMAKPVEAQWIRPSANRDSSPGR